MKTGDKVKVVIKRDRSAKRIGKNGHAPDSIVININGESDELKNGEIMQVSETTKSNVVNRNASPLPLINARIVNGRYADYFKKIEEKKTSTESTTTNN